MKKLLDTFLRHVFWESEQGFCRKLPVGHGVRAIALRSRTNVMGLLQSIVAIRQACLSLMYPKVSLQELLFRELDTNESTACYEYMFDQWLADDRHWREEQGAIYRRRADYWKPFNAYTKRVYGGKHFVHAIFQVGLSWLPNGQDGISPQDALA